jgi:hypothetical protein
MTKATALAISGAASPIAVLVWRGGYGKVTRLNFEDPLDALLAAIGYVRQKYNVRITDAGCEALEAMAPELERLLPAEGGLPGAAKRELKRHAPRVPKVPQVPPVPPADPEGTSFARRLKKPAAAVFAAPPVPAELAVLPSHDEQRLIAAVDLVGRTGAKHFEVGYLHDDVPMEEAAWYAHARYRGTRISVENQLGPAEAAEALALRLLTGAKCACGKLVALSGDGALAFRNPVMSDGSRFPLDEAVRAGQCRWKRDGERWVSGCGLRGRPR